MTRVETASLKLVDLVYTVEVLGFYARTRYLHDLIETCATKRVVFRVGSLRSLYFDNMTSLKLPHILGILIP